MKEINFGTAKLMTETMNIAAVLIALVGIVKALNNLGVMSAILVLKDGDLVIDH